MLGCLKLLSFTSYILSGRSKSNSNEHAATVDSTAERAGVSVLMLFTQWPGSALGVWEDCEWNRYQIANPGKDSRFLHQPRTEDVALNSWGLCTLPIISIFPLAVLKVNRYILPGTTLLLWEGDNRYSRFLQNTSVFFPNATTCPYRLRGPPSQLWLNCNRLLRLGRPQGAVTLLRWCEWWYVWEWSTRRGLKPTFYRLPRLWSQWKSSPGVPWWALTFWHRNFLNFFSTPVCKMWIIQEPKKVALWNKRNFEEKEMESVKHV
jgi:hypothetical protein